MRASVNQPTTYSVDAPSMTIAAIICLRMGGSRSRRHYSPRENVEGLREILAHSAAYVCGVVRQRSTAACGPR